MVVKKQRRREKGAGSIRQRESGRWQARRRLPDGTMQSAPATFDTKLDATAWLDNDRRVQRARQLWTAPA
jgi:hypothetical protein